MSDKVNHRAVLERWNWLKQHQHWDSSWQKGSRFLKCVYFHGHKGAGGVKADQLFSILFFFVFLLLCQKCTLLLRILSSFFFSVRLLSQKDIFAFLYIYMNICLLFLLCSFSPLPKIYFHSQNIFLHLLFRFFLTENNFFLPNIFLLCLFCSSCLQKNVPVRYIFLHFHYNKTKMG